MGPVEETQKWRTIKHSFETPPTGPDNRIITSRFTLLTFLPKSVLEQFRKKSNIFYLFTSIIMLVIPVPGEPMVFIVTFLVIMSISIFKSGYEDWLRYKADNQVNNREIQVLDAHGHIDMIKSEKLRVGQVIRLDENEDVPCDLLLLSAVSQTGNIVTTCGVNTANLDGEQNMKIRVCPTRFHRDNSSGNENFASSLASSELVVEFEEPTVDLYKLNGSVTTAQAREKLVPLLMENFLLRGTTLKNAQFIHGLVIYTGSDTRLSLNLAQRKFGKFSVIDEGTNRLILITAGILILICGLSLGGFFWFEGSITFGKAWYLTQFEGTQILLALETLLIFLVFMNPMVPIGLSASIEGQKWAAGVYFGWDDDMKSVETGDSAICNNSDVVDELGQIEYLLTDKTGTLTENNLRFKCCSYGGAKYEYTQDENGNQFDLAPQNISSGLENSNEKLEFLESITLCHTVQAVKKEGEWKYQGTSSDEEVLLAAANSLGVTFKGEDNHGKLLIFKEGKQTGFKRHFVFEFDADRKCMSVVVEDAEGGFHLITKGAENSLLPKCEQNSVPKMLLECTSHVAQFAKRGLRTLVIGKREISAEEFKSIQSNIELVRRDPSALAQFYTQIETNLRILGVTGVEDSLQSNVPETLKALKEAGIRIWVLTGDKLETALNIAMTCGLIHGKCSSFCTDENSFSECTTSLANISTPNELTHKLQSIREKLDLDHPLKTLVIDSTSFAIGYETCRELFGSVAMAFPQIIFCRMTPLQKALVVKLIKSTRSSARICAVGDGGNDVAMIQEAHVGIGILGREGRQAARAADFAIPKFEHLRKAILVHGNWNYSRLSTLVMHLIYQSFPMCLSQAFYGIDSGFTGFPLIDRTFGMFYSILFANIPINVYAATERPHSAEKLLRNPEMYKNVSHNILLGPKATLYGMMSGIWHASLIIALPRLIWPQIHALDWASYSHFMNAALVAVTNMKALFQTRTFTWLTIFSHVFSFGSMVLIYSLMSEVFGTGMLQYAYFSMLSRPDFWFLTLLVTVLSLLSDFTITTLGVVYPIRFKSFVQSLKVS